MMAIKVGINGYGRIGRNILRALYEGKHGGDIKIVALNDLGDANTNAHLTRFDTVHGRFRGEVHVDGDSMVVNGDRIRVVAQRDPAKLPWAELGVDYVLECTGLFTSKAKASAHLAAGAKKVLISAPGGDDVDATIVYGANHGILKSSMSVVSNASCTTNCLVPLVKVLHEKIGVLAGVMNTVHSYTNDQVLTDVYHSDLRRARSATMSMIPTKTGAAAAVGLVMPELKGKIDGFSIRVPTINVSFVDLTFTAARKTTVEEIHGAIRAAANGPLKGILAYNDQPLVSVDFNHDPASSTYDATMTKVIEGTLVKVCSWYDNEWGFSNRMLDTTLAWSKAAWPMKIANMSSLDLHHKRVLIREDLNVPIQGGVVSSDARIRAALPTIQTALNAKARVLVMSHLGRPEEGTYAEEFSLAPVAKRLAQLLGVPVALKKDWLDGVEAAPGEVVLLENVRFNKGEKKDSDDLSRRMAALCDIYVMDAFGTAHRAEASTHGVAKYASVACAGPLLVSELSALETALEKPARPLLAIVAGSKVSTKLTVLESLLSKVDQLIVGGGITNTFLAALGFNVGKSLYEPNMLDICKRLLEQSKNRGIVIPMPTDVVVATEFSAKAEADVKDIRQVSADDMILDIGPDSAEAISTLVASAGTILWNGPVGVFEFPQFGEGTRALATAIARSKAFSLAGGGDTLAAIEKYGVEDSISYISTGGGAFLEFVEGKKLPAVEILERRAA